jgi:hypothetical protein
MTGPAQLVRGLPLAVIMVDERCIRDFLPQLGERVTEGMVILDPVQVCRYGGDRNRATTDPKRQHLVMADLRSGAHLCLMESQGRTTDQGVRRRSRSGGCTWRPVHRGPARRS